MERIFDRKLVKNGSKKLGRAPQKKRPFSGSRPLPAFWSIFGRFWAPVWHPFGSFGLPWHPRTEIQAPLWALLAPFWTFWGQFWDPFRSNLKKGCKNKEKSRFLAPESAKIVRNLPCSSIFRLQTVFPRPGGGTIAAGNLNSPPRRTARRACWGFGRFWGPFWHPFGCFGLPLVPFWLHFGPFWLHFGPFWVNFVTLFVPT